MKPPPFLKCYLTTAIVLLFIPAAFAQYITLMASSLRTNSQTINIATNELATVVHLSTPAKSGISYAYLEVVCKGHTNRYQVNYMIGGYDVNNSTWYSTHANLPVIAGPASLRLVGQHDPPRAAVCTLQITKPSSTFTPVNTVVIPNDSNGPVTIVLESSTDMVNWIPANPGTYGTSATNRFFRVRGER